MAYIVPQARVGVCGGGGISISGASSVSLP